MQMQDYLPFFQDLLIRYYQFTLENPVYAACLAIAVWLLTTVFYSLRIGLLNRRNRINLKVSFDAQNSLATAQLEIQKLQGEIAASKDQVEQEAQRTLDLRERIAGLAGQLKDSIVALAAEPDLGQQGLSVTDDLEAEHLWQRYSTAVKHLGETLIAERKANGELQQAYNTETAKLAEKDGQLQAMQTRLDSQNQRLVKLELSNEEHKTQLAQQQEIAQRRLSEVEAKYQSELARLAALEKQAPEWAQAKIATEKPKAVEVRAAEPVPLKPAEVQSIPAQAVSVEPEPRLAKIEPKPSVKEEAIPEPTIARAETAKQKPKAAAQAAGGVTGKFKSLFAGAKQQMEKLDDMFGLSTPMLEPEASGRAGRSVREAQTMVTNTSSAEPVVPIPEQQRPAGGGEASSAGVAGKFENPSASSQASSVETEAVVEKTAAAPVESVQPPADVTDPSASKTTGKLKNLFAKFKRTS